MWQRFTERARLVIFYAQEEAEQLGENFVGVEHILLGVLREPDNVACRVLGQRVPIEKVQREIERQCTRGNGRSRQEMQLTPRARRSIELTYQSARSLNVDYIGTEHILLGLILEGDGLAARVLVKLGFDYSSTFATVLKMLEDESNEQAAPAASEPATIPVVSAAAKEDPMKRLWSLPYSELRTMAQAAQMGTHPTAAASAALVAVDLARRNCTDVQHLRSVNDVTGDQAWAILSLARVFKDTVKISKVAHREILTGRVLAMVFEKPSLRTRCSFEVGMVQLGGHAIYLQPSDIGLGKRETVADVAHNLERMADGIMARVFAHATIEELAANSRVPVINGLCDREHPCQAFADLLTVWEHRGDIAGQRIAYIGDGNNVAHSLLLLAAKLGAHVVIASPEGYEPAAEIVSRAQSDASGANGSVRIVQDPREAVKGVDVVYTDIWASMGQEAEAESRAKVFAPFQVTAELMSGAKPDALFMHCLPAHRGEEVTAEVVDGPQSVVFDQAENRLHAQKAVLAVLVD